MRIPLNLKVLVLDDEPFMLKLLAYLLAKKGFQEVATCDNGSAALALVDSPYAAPQLIFCDINMPGMDGVEFVRRLVEHGYSGSLVLVSGEDERTLQSMRRLVQAHHIEVLGCLQKPVTPASLEVMMEAWRMPAAAPRTIVEKIYHEEELRRAIAMKQLINYYQPKVALSTGKVVGVEALVRWQHPTDGLVYPDQFIGVAEAHGLINDLTHSVLKQALQDMASWKQMGLEVQVSVNVSMDNLSALDFPDTVSALAASAGIAPTALILEVTESRLMHDLRAPLEILTRLRLKRFGLSIDDFGTGHSSLTQLRDLPFDELKIDRSFVHGAHDMGNIRAIFSASVGLAKELGMKVVAEGVEDAGDWAFLRFTDCDLAQGYHISKPIPASDFVAWVDLYRRRLGT
ncbi:EAL domain-containing response regulator [Rhodoferax saidenbachensis]|uniref:EAL domain-containing protein (Putative c-di-GMP-specific phosphodiesterase class I)/FixJ family two-component response regulator n=1 Tax=Rhodoferax saidenbachensis TaxID=1484693 RepID=A0ABU1ZS74_9BURK|nr:EAL domain-containing response regulator [Rhodoferax saidenbachensis]MDR7308392.1 EAL domain-containing protein (putative c-di-GMP-specific phosphodiesterase class I)/FixJ family two-component response regulator [Rhodoferax saidenbachensis]